VKRRLLALIWAFTPDCHCEAGYFAPHWAHYRTCERSRCVR
jgi:hypothetical protein